MEQVVCDECQRPISKTSSTAVKLRRVFDEPREINDPMNGDMCSVACLRQWLDHEYPVERPDFDAARRALDPLYDAETEAAADALADAVDDGMLDDETPSFEGEPFNPGAFIDGILGRKLRGARSGQLRNHGLGTPLANPSKQVG